MRGVWYERGLRWVWYERGLRWVWYERGSRWCGMTVVVDLGKSWGEGGI